MSDSGEYSYSEDGKAEPVAQPAAQAAADEKIVSRAAEAAKDDDRLAPYMEKFNEIVTDKKKGCNKDQFVAVMRSLNPDIDIDVIGIYFRGVDIDGGESISEDEFKDFINSYLSGEETYKVKILFRAYDADRSGYLSTDEIMNLAKTFGSNISREAAEQVVATGSNPKKGLNFPEVHKLITGKAIASTADAYDGKRKSSCCLIV